MAVNACGVLLVLAAFELYFRSRAPEHPSYTVTRGLDAFDQANAYGYYRQHPQLGYGPKAGTRVRSKLERGGATIYDVEYTIDEFGFRAGSAARRDADVSLLFLGCSYTFGEGVNDDQTFPARFEALDPGRRRGINLGFHGYGPHQMLRIVESQLEAPTVGASRPEYGVYLAIPDHVARISGRVSWDNGPRYRLSAEGALELVPSAEKRWTRSLAENLMQSKLLAYVFEHSVYSPGRVTPRDWDLYAAAVIGTAQRIRERYGGGFIAFLVEDPRGGLAWDPAFAPKLRAAGVTVLEAAKLAPDFAADPRYFLHGDPHPSALGHDRLARVLVEELARAGR